MAQIECYELQNAVDKIRLLTSDKCKEVSNIDLLYILDVIEAIINCTEIDYNNDIIDSVLYEIQNKTEEQKAVARNNINAISKDEVIELITNININLKNEILNEITNLLINSNFDKHFTYTQIQPSTEWNIIHNLNKRPTVVVVDTSGDEIIGLVKYNITDINRLKIVFNYPVNGYAYLN